MRSKFSLVLSASRHTPDERADGDEEVVKDSISFELASIILVQAGGGAGSDSA